MFKRLIAVGFICAFLFLLVDSRPGESAQSIDTFSLGEIVVTGQKESIADVTVSHVLTQADIMATNSKTVADALQFVPGVVVTRGRKNEPEISIHGFGQEKSLFLIDGIPYYETYYGKLSLDQVPADIISRIEITKNAPSVLYGANAQIAVINVITRKGTEKPSFHLTGEIGENNTYRTGFSHGNQIGAVNYWISFSHDTSDGWKLSDDFEPEIARRARKFMPNVDGIHEGGGFRENADFEKNKLWARAGVTPSAGSEYFISFHLLDSELGHPPATNEYRILLREGDVPGFSTFSRYEDYDDWGIDLSGKEALFDALTVRGKLFFHNHEDAYVSYDGPDYNTVIAKSTYKDKVLGTSLFGDFSLTEFHEGHVSFHYRKDIHDAADDDYLPYNTYESFTGSIGTEHGLHYENGLSLFAGIAWDWFEVDKAQGYAFDADDLFTGKTDLKTPSTQDECNPMIGFSWAIEETSVFGSIARRTQFPSLHQLYSSSSGNMELSPEKTINYTLGVSHRFNPKMSGEVSGFYHDISDWISRDYYEEGYSGNEIYMNVEEVAMQGVEASLTAVMCDYFKMNFNYMFNDAKNKSRLRATDKVIGVPKHKFGVGFNAMIPVILVSVDMQGIYADEVYDSLPTSGSPDDEITKSDDYFIAKTRISRSLKDKYTLFAEVDNLFDRNYEEEVGFPARGRNFRIGAVVDF
ncbi:MAG: TonB-dependent receptor [Desulfobacterales bacterium]|jgi:outer membrane cobalamin receptor|nr:TonB-dependent receptor [Desulfobacterales bacterium]